MTLREYDLNLFGQNLPELGFIVLDSGNEKEKDFVN